MDRLLSSLRGSPVWAADGRLGLLTDVFFHDGLWLVRNLAVQANPSAQRLSIPLASVPGGCFHSSGIRLPLAASELRRLALAQDLTVRSARSLAGYLVEAADGPAGRLEDLLVSDAGWWIPSFVVNTQTLLPGSVHVVPSSAVWSIDSVNRRLRLRVKRDAIACTRSRARDWMPTDA